MKSIVTGGGGFIGSHIVDRLLAEGQDVIVIDNCSTGRLENRAHHKGDAHLTIVEADICDYERIAPLFTGVDWAEPVPPIMPMVSPLLICKSISSSAWRRACSEYLKLT